MATARTLIAAFLLTFTLAFVTTLCAQQPTRTEAGVGVASHTFTGIDGQRHLTTGPFGQFTYNFSSFLALEGSAAYLPEFTRTHTQENGEEFSTFAGIKAGIRKQRFGVFGKLEPGFTSFSCGLGYLGPNGSLINCQRRTNFAFQYGGVAEYYLSNRWTLRGDVAQTLVTEFDQTLARYPDGFPAEITFGREEHHLDLRLSLVRRFGAPQTDLPSPESRLPIDIGVLFALQARVHSFLSNIYPDNGGGLWVSWNPWKYAGIDVSTFYLPNNDGFIGYIDGGPALESFVGPKIGIRKGKVGVFAKVRPGTIVFSRLVDSQVPPIASETTYSKFPQLALDTGGVLEVYPARHIILRSDASNETIFYRSRTVRENDKPYPIPSGHQSSFLFTTGLGIRF